MVEFDAVRQLIGEVLHVEERAQQFDQDTLLLGSIPEFDSMAVVALIHALEEQFAIQIDDDELSAETFESVGRVYALVCQKVMASGIGACSSS